MRSLVSFLSLFTCCLAIAADSTQVVRYSPNKLYFVAWFDSDAGVPLGVVRSIVVRNASDPEDIFSIVSVPRATHAAWNPASNRCVIADAPDNGGPITWLVYQKKTGKWDSRRLDPFELLEKAFYKADPEVHHLFRPSFRKIEWLSDTKVCFHGYCNSGTYLITVDTASPDSPPIAKKLSNKWIDE